MILLSMSGLVHYIAAVFTSAATVHDDVQFFEHPLESRSVQDCITGETALPVCFGGVGQTPRQNLNVSDIAYLGNELRNIDKTNMAKGIYSYVGIPADNITGPCKTLLLRTHNTAMILLEHLDPTVFTNVLVKDIAATIDGILWNETSTGIQSNGGIIACGGNGGSQGVIVDTLNPYYWKQGYLRSGCTPYGVLVKVMSTAS